jgi:hypothetical protein
MGLWLHGWMTNLWRVISGPPRIGKTGQMGTAFYPEAGIYVIQSRHPRASGSEVVALALGAG